MTWLSDRKTYAVIIITLLLCQNTVFAEDAKLTNIVVTNTRDDLLVYLNVEGAFREKMKTAILSGVPTTFSFFISLYMTRNWWKDKNIADLKITHTIKYNNLKKEFTVQRSWEDGEPIATQSYGEAERLMTEIYSLKLAPLSVLERGRQYQLKAKAQLNKVTLPFYLHYVLIFVSLWDFETDLYTIDFIY